jgi:hypothetical protein
MTATYEAATVVPVLDGQLVLDLGAGFESLHRGDESRHRVEVVLVVCHVCSGHHPVERCPQRLTICSVCSAAHHPTVHLLDVLPRGAVG